MAQMQSSDNELIMNKHTSAQYKVHNVNYIVNWLSKKWIVFIKEQNKEKKGKQKIKTTAIAIQYSGTRL